MAAGLYSSCLSFNAKCDKLPLQHELKSRVHFSRWKRNGVSHHIKKERERETVIKSDDTVKLKKRSIPIAKLNLPETRPDTRVLILS